MPIRSAAASIEGALGPRELAPTLMAEDWCDERPTVQYVAEPARDQQRPRRDLAGIVLVIMIVTGIALAMHYTPHTSLAFDSVERIMRDVNYGWLIRYIHMNGASFFFIFVSGYTQ